MRVYYKICLIVMLVCLLNTFGYYCTENNISYGLNPLWFTVSNVVQIACAVLSLLMFFPIVAMDTDHEKLGFLRDTGEEPYYNLIVLYPFIILLCVNIQLGSTVNGITLAFITAFAFSFSTVHRSVRRWHIIRMAENGTKNT